MTNLKLSEHFYLQDFIKSDIAKQHGIANYPEVEEIHKIVDLCSNVLEVVRRFYGKPVEISSGYRCRELNKFVGGASNSQHTKGEACDFFIRGVSNYAICKAIEAMREQGKIEFDQCILEPSWVHVSFRFGFNRNEFLTRDKRQKSGYSKGILDLY